MSFWLVQNLSYSPLEKGDTGVVRERFPTSGNDRQCILTYSLLSNLPNGSSGSSKGTYPKNSIILWHMPKLRLSPMLLYESLTSSTL
ncbi:MAG: hypothetical protein A2Z47_07955 [Thermodesulfovibrio sp. RBG_19FT_COMBO_42_12]|nr:MAG: hypothetical protein A2Z47_07955 [Thermodesulfovibrio sp. RBG_19FT_COMBO_42_12]